MEQSRERLSYAYPTQLDVIIVPNFVGDGAFDKCFKFEAPLDVVMHTASPFSYSVTDIQREVLDPTISGTVILLEAIRNNAPSTKKVRWPPWSQI